MNNSTKILLKILLALVFVLISLLVAAISWSLSREEGESWAAALRQGGKGFVASITVTAALYTAIILLP